eukprot:Skav209695  [mRNA]  locus=scaffold36:83270:83587:+ [translate_table: standard]
MSLLSGDGHSWILSFQVPGRSHSSALFPGGQERFRAMTHLYYRDAAGAVIVYDCTDAHSQASVDYWVQELQNKGPARCCMAVAANKSDVESKAVDPKQMKAGGQL